MTPPIALLVCGSRSWTDERFMGKALAKYPRGTLLVHGGAAGADLIAGGMAYTRGWAECVLPYFHHMGKRGGFARNTVMAKLVAALALEGGFRPHVEAFDLGTDGTAMMCRIAEEYGFPIARHRA